MGLELAEFILALQDEFDVDIFDEDVWNISTFEDIVSLLEQKISDAPHSQAEADGLQQKNFFEIQKFFAKELDVNISQLTPETETASLLRPLTIRRKIWNKLRKEMSKSIPPLYGKQYRAWIGGTSVVIGFVLGLGVSVEWGIIAGIFYGLVFFGILFLLLMGFWHFCFSWLFSTVPKDCNSLERIARCMTPKICLDSVSKPWTRETIIESVMRITSEQLNIPSEKIYLTDEVVNVFNYKLSRP